MSRLQLGLWSGRVFFPTQSIRSRSSHEDRGRRAPEGRRGDWGAAPRRTSVSITCHRLSDEQRRFTRAHFARYYAKRAEDSSLLRSYSSRRAFCAAINLCYAPRERCAWKQRIPWKEGVRRRNGTRWVICRINNNRDPTPFEYTT